MEIVKRILILLTAVIISFFILLAFGFSLNNYFYHRRMDTLVKKFDKTVWVRTSADQPKSTLGGRMNSVTQSLKVGEMMSVESVSWRTSGIADTVFEATFTDCGKKKSVAKVNGYLGEVFGFESFFQKVEDTAIIEKCLEKQKNQNFDYRSPLEEYNNSVWKRMDTELKLRTFEGEGVNPLKNEISIGGYIKVTNVYQTNPPLASPYSFTYTDCSNKRNSLTVQKNLVYLVAFEEIYERVENPEVISSCLQ